MMIRPPVAGLEWVEDLETVMLAGEQEVVNDGTWVRRTRLRCCGNVFPAVVVRDCCVGCVAMSRCTFPFSFWLYSLFVSSMQWPLAGSQFLLFYVKMTLLRHLQLVRYLVHRRRGQWPACLLPRFNIVAALLPLSIPPRTPGPLPLRLHVAHITPPKTISLSPSLTPQPRSCDPASNRSHFTYPLRLLIPLTLSPPRVSLLHPLPQQSHSLTRLQPTPLALPFSIHND